MATATIVSEPLSVPVVTSSRDTKEDECPDTSPCEVMSHKMLRYKAIEAVMDRYPNVTEFMKSESPNIVCTRLPSHWRSNKSLPVQFAVIALGQVKNGTEVTIKVGNEENLRGEIKSATATMIDRIAKFNDLRFVGRSGRGKHFDMTITIKGIPWETVIYSKLIKVTVDGPREPRHKPQDPCSLNRKRSGSGDTSDNSQRKMSECSTTSCSENGSDSGLSPRSAKERRLSPTEDSSPSSDKPKRLIPCSVSGPLGSIPEPTPLSVTHRPTLQEIQYPLPLYPVNPLCPLLPHPAVSIDPAATLRASLAMPPFTMHGSMNPPFLPSPLGLLPSLIMSPPNPVSTAIDTLITRSQISNLFATLPAFASPPCFLPVLGNTATVPMSPPRSEPVSVTQMSDIQCQTEPSVEFPVQKSLWKPYSDS